MRSLLSVAIILSSVCLAHADCKVENKGNGVWLFDCARGEFAEALSAWRARHSAGLKFRVVPQAAGAGYTSLNIVYVE